MMIDIKNKLQTKRVLVTGAAGFIGSRLVKMLLENGAEVYAVVDEGGSTERIDSLKNHDKLHIIQCSLENRNALAAQRAGWGNINYVVHLWLKIPARKEFCEQSIEEVNLNLLPAINLIKELGNSIEGICFASSMSVYGNPSHVPLSENDVPAPNSSYGATKLAIENYLRSYGTAHNVPVTILRYSTVYGPGELNHRAIPNFIRNTLEGKPPVINGDGLELRDYVHVDDVVRATVLALISGKSQVFNIGSGRGSSTLEIARKVLELNAVKIEPRFAPYKNPAVNIICDISAAKEALSYTPQVNLEDGLKQEIDWFKTSIQRTAPEQSGMNITASEQKRSHKGLISYEFTKDLFDRIFSVFVLTVLSPLMALIAIGIRIDSHGSAVYKQERIGKNGRKFIAYKFRTMSSNNDDSKYKEYLRKYVLENAPYRVNDDGQSVYKVDDCHITKFGALLRKTNLDELPQFYNVLKGDMSVIGPRPDVPYAVEMYRDWHKARLQVKPGITGLWQVRGRKWLSFDDMTKLDIEYIEKQSFLLDLKIAVLTIRTMVKMDGS